MNAEYLNANFGGVLVVFDRLFGTYVREDERVPIRYGIVGEAPTHNPFIVLFIEWARIFRDLLGPHPLATKLMLAFGPPGWRPATTARDSGDAGRMTRTDIADGGLR